MHFGVHFLDNVYQGKRILSFDESQIEFNNYPGYKWIERGKQKNIKVSPMWPRMTLVIAVDNLGNIYCCIFQANSNQLTSALMLTKLVRQLETEDPNFRDNTVI